MLLKKIFYGIIFSANLICCNLSFSQNLNFKHYSVDQGLPSSQVHDIIQDKYGNLWFTTDHGLSRYNGYNFENFTTENGLTDNTVFKFYPQKNGDIWCTSFNKSIFSISGSNPIFKPYAFNIKLLSLPDYFITNCIHFSEDQSLYMSIINGDGYIHIDKRGNTIHNSIILNSKINEIILLNTKDKSSFFYTKNKLTNESIEGNWLDTINSGKSPILRGLTRACYLDATKTGIFTDPKSIRILSSNNNDSIYIPTSYEPISLGKLNDSLFWVGFRYGGINIYNLSGKKIHSFLTDKSVTQLYIDHEKGLWLSTLNDGVYHATNTEVVLYDDNKSVDSWVNSLKKDKNGNLWIGYYNGDVSVLAKNKITNKYKSFKKLPALIRSDVSDDRIYFISDTKIFNDQKKEIFDNKSQATNIYVHQNDSFFVCGYRQIYLFNNQKLKAIDIGFRINDICYHQDVFYLATNKGLFKLKKELIEQVQNIKILSSLKIIDLECWQNSLLLGTKNNGVLILENNIVYNVGQKQGLNSNIVNKVYIENDSVFWACTNSGLNRVIFKNHKIIRIDDISNRNGLISNEVTAIEIINDTVWVGTREGLCSFPKNMLQNKKVNTNYYLEINYLKVNDQTCDKKEMISLNYDQNRIELGFKAISFFDGPPLLYRYKLEGVETEWNYTTRLSSVYTSLSPHTYTFYVEVKGKNNKWESNRQQFSFTICPPFWKTWWFVSITIFALVILIYLFFRFRILTYNRDITRELLRQLLKRIRKKSNYIIFREQGKDIRIATDMVYFVKADGNYIELHTDIKKYVIRYKIGEFLNLVPDPLEYLRISRSCIIRLDKVQEKSKKDVTIKGEKLPVGETYLDQLQKIQF